MAYSLIYYEEKQKKVLGRGKLQIILLQNINRTTVLIKRMMDDGIIRFSKSGKKMNTDFSIVKIARCLAKAPYKRRVIKLLDIQRNPSILGQEERKGLTMTRENSKWQMHSPNKCKCYPL